MIITIDMLDKSGVMYDWKTLYVGIKLNLVDYNDLTTYANKIMNDDTYVDNEFINELTWGIDESLKNEIVVKMPLEFNFEMLTPESTNWTLEIEKLRYTILNYLRTTTETVNELLSKIEEVYSDFNYPHDMDTFIRYMPLKNTSNLSENTIENNYKCMIHDLDNFLMLEKKKIDVKNKPTVFL